MKTDEIILRIIIALLAFLIMGVIVGHALLNHWQRQSDDLSRPNPAAVRQLAP